MYKRQGKIPTGLPDWMSKVSSSSKFCNALMINVNASLFLAALPLPPYTIKSVSYTHLDVYKRQIYAFLICAAVAIFFLFRNVKNVVMVCETTQN